jgi:hypothetical protein
MVMNKIVLMVSSLMVGSLMTVVFSQPAIRPGVASAANICAGAQGKPASTPSMSTEVGGIRFQTLITQDNIPEQSTVMPPEREIQFPQRTSKNFFKGDRSPDTHELVNIYVRAKNCTNQAIRFGRFGSLSPVKLFASNGQELKPSESSFGVPIDLMSAGSVLVQPGDSINFKMEGLLAWEGNSLTLLLGRQEERYRETFPGLQPGESYQIQLAYVNNTNQKPFSKESYSITDQGRILIRPLPPAKEVEVWKGKATPPPVQFHIVQMKK